MTAILMQHDDDRTLIRFASGESADGACVRDAERERALERLMERHADAVAAWLRPRVGSPEIARDIAHDVFLPARLRNYRGDSAVRSYLIGVAKHLLMHHERDVARERARGMQSLDQLRDHAGVDPADPARAVDARAIAAELVQRVFAALSARELEIVQLRYMDGLDFAEIATRLAIASVDTVKSVHRRAMLRLRAMWDEHGDSSASMLLGIPLGAPIQSNPQPSNGRVASDTGVPR